MFIKCVVLDRKVQKEDRAPMEVEYQEYKVSPLVIVVPNFNLSFSDRVTYVTKSAAFTSILARGVYWHTLN